jgi:tripartite-type tricarboxylate transporter receptor subunit TctC
VGRPVATTPGTPPERVEALRRAFDATLKDPLFIADAKKQHLEINSMTGEELTRIVNDVINVPKALLAKVVIATDPRAVQPTAK